MPRVKVGPAPPDASDVASLQARSRNVLRRGPVSVWAWQLKSPERNRGRAVAIVVGRVGSASVFRSKAANARALRLDPFLCPDTLGAPGVHGQSPGMASQPSQLRGLGGEADSCRARLAPSLSDTERCGALLLRSRSARSDHRLAALIHMHMLESSCRGRHRNDTSIATEGSPKPVKCTAIAALCVQAICITRAHSSSPRAWRPR